MKRKLEEAEWPGLMNKIELSIENRIKLPRCVSIRMFIKSEVHLKMAGNLSEVSDRW